MSFDVTDTENDFKATDEGVYGIKCTPTHNMKGNTMICTLVFEKY